MTPRLSDQALGELSARYESLFAPESTTLVESAESADPGPCTCKGPSSDQLRDRTQSTEELCGFCRFLLTLSLQDLARVAQFLAISFGPSERLRLHHYVSLVDVAFVNMSWETGPRLFRMHYAAATLRWLRSEDSNIWVALFALRAAGKL